MNIRGIDRIAQELMGEEAEHSSREPGWLYYHGNRTGRISLWLSEQLGIEINRDIVYVGALFHDIAKGTDPHNVIGAERATYHLTPYCNSDELNDICEIIRLHNKRNVSNHSASVKLVQDADLLDHVGPIAVWLAFYWSGSKTDGFHKHMRFIHGEDNKLYRRGMRECLNFDISIEEFNRRVAFEDDFFSTFHSVYLDGILPRAR